MGQLLVVRPPARGSSAIVLSQELNYKRVVKCWQAAEAYLALFIWYEVGPTGWRKLAFLSVLIYES